MPARREPERIVSSVENMPRSWRRETKPHKFCPGCGHPIILKALGEAIDELAILDRVVYGWISAVPSSAGISSMWTVSKPTTAGPPPSSSA